VDPLDSLVYQSELPFERDAVQCRDGRWVFVKFRKAPSPVLAEAGTKKEIMELAERMSEMPLWEEHYVGMSMIKCVPPEGVYRHPQTCFLVTDGSPRPSKPEPESHEAAPETPRSAGWQEERPSDWKRVKAAVVRKIRGL
jgi:hypothetical protein